MAGRYVRKGRTASGAVCVQVVTKVAGVIVAVEQVGSAHTDAELALLLAAARERLLPGQGELDLGDLPQVAARVDEIADWTRSKEEGQLDLDVPAASSSSPVRGRGRPSVAGGGGRVVATASLTLWRVLEQAYSRLGFDSLGDEAFKALVLARVIEATSKADSRRVLDDIGVWAPSLRTIFRALKRAETRGYRDRLATACMAHAARAGAAATLVLFDCTTLFFHIDDEDDLRKVGMSKERRVDPQIQVGLLVDRSGFPLEIHCFEGNTAETKTLIPVLSAFQDRHGVTDMVVVADAGMLSAANLNALEDADCRFIVGSRQSRAPYDLEPYFAQHGNYIPDGSTVETTREMGTGKDKRRRRVVYHYSFKRHKRDDRTINAQITKAEQAAAGKRPVARDRFVKVTTDAEGKKAEVNWDVIDRARAAAGLKGYVTNLPTDAMDGAAVVAAYHDLWHVEESFRMAKNDLQARPIFHRKKDSIEAHLTVVFAALAVARHLQDRTGVSIKRLIQTLRPLQSVTITIAGEQVNAQPRLTPEATAILDKIPDLAGH